MHLLSLSLFSVWSLGLCISEYRPSEVLGNIFMGLERFVPGLLVIFLRHREVPENSLFYLYSSHSMFHHTLLHPARCLITSERITWITFSCLSLITCCQKFKVSPVSPDFMGRSWLVKMRRATDVSFSVGQPISVLSHDPHTLPPLASYLQQELLRGGPKAVLRRMSKTDVDLPMSNFLKIL